MNKLILTLLMLTTLTLSAWEGKSKEIYQFFMQTEYHEVADVITAMSILETGWYRSKAHQCRNNMFSIKTTIRRKWTDCNNKPCGKPICRMHHFKTEEQGYQHVLNHFKRKGFSVNRKQFFQDLTAKGYAEDKSYQKKLKWIIRNKLIKILRLYKQ